MSRWFAMLNEMQAAPTSVQNVQNNGGKRFEHSEQFEQPTKASIAKAAPHIDQTAYNERAGIIQANGIPQEWAEGYATLCTMPCPSVYPLKRWRQLVDDGGHFLDTWGRQAAALGWRALDCFGVNFLAPESRYDGMGLIPLIHGKRVVAITALTARIECGRSVFQTYYRQPVDGAVAVWQLSSPEPRVKPATLIDQLPN